MSTLGSFNFRGKERKRPWFSSTVTKTKTHNLESFTIFQGLPTELRLNIWKTVCFQTRTIDLSMFMKEADVPRSKSKEVQIYNTMPHSWHSKCHHPAVLQVNVESRAEGLKHYELAFGVDYSGRTNLDDVIFPGEIYINWAVDRIFLTGLDDIQEIKDLNGNNQVVNTGRLTAARAFRKTIADNNLRFLAYRDRPLTRITLLSLAFKEPTIEELILVDGDQEPFPVRHRGDIDLSVPENDTRRLAKMRIVTHVINRRWEQMVEKDKEPLEESDESEDSDGGIAESLEEVRHLDIKFRKY